MRRSDDERARIGVTEILPCDYHDLTRSATIIRASELLPNYVDGLVTSVAYPLCHIAVSAARVTRGHVLQLPMTTDVEQSLDAPLKQAWHEADEL